MVQLFEGTRRNWKRVLVFIVACTLFWLAQLAFQLFLDGADFNTSLIRSFAFTGATLMALSLLSSIAFKFRPALMRHISLRRNLGVMGFAFIVLHVMSVVNFGFGGDFTQIFYSLDPVENALLAGFAAEIILFVVTLTSCDFIQQRLGPKWWKSVQRLVYVAFLLAIYHFMTANPAAVFGSLPGYFLVLVTVLTLIGQLYWFFRISADNQFKSKGFLIGLAIIVFGLILAFFALKKLKII